MFTLRALLPMKIFLMIKESCPHYGQVSTVYAYDQQRKDLCKVWLGSFLHEMRLVKRVEVEVCTCWGFLQGRLHVFR